MARNGYLALVFFLLLCCVFSFVDAQGVPMTEHFNNQNDEVPSFGSVAERRLKFLVPDSVPVLEYHNGPILSSPITPVYAIWYGAFTDQLKSAVSDFFLSFNGTQNVAPSVSSWWNLTLGYVDETGRPITTQMSLDAQMDDNYSLGKVLNQSDLDLLVLRAVNSSFPANAQSIYLVLTADDVQVMDFCSYSCASHFATSPASSSGGVQLAYAWVGNAEKLCPGKCAWPFAKPEYGPDSPALTPPNADVGTDGMIINLAAMIAGICTNPYNNGYYEGDGAAPLEAVTACVGMFGEGAYSGYPGLLQKDDISGASFNAHGVKGRNFLLPALWSPATRACATV